MLPKNFNIKDIDEGIRNLVITLNRIPRLHTSSTCEGHIFNTPELTYPRNGWLNFFYKNEELGLIKNIEYFCENFDLFNLEKAKNAEPQKYTINGNFATPGLLEGLKFKDWPENKKKEYLNRAEIRREEILLGWAILDTKIKEYITRNITKDINSLPYIKN